MPGANPNRRRTLWVITALWAYVLTRGPLSIWLQSSFDCGPLLRVLDIAMIQTALLAWMVITSYRQRRLLRHTRTIMQVFVPLAVVAALSAIANRQSVLQVFSIGLLEFGWLFLALCAVVVRPLSATRLIQRRSIQISSAVAGTAALVYVLALHDNLDRAAGFGACGTSEFLLVGGDSGWLRSRGFARNPNELGVLLLVPLALATSRLQWKPNWWWPTSAILALVIGISFSRSALIGVGLIALVQGWRLLRIRFNHQTVGIGFAGLAILGIIVGAVGLNSDLGQELILHQTDDDQGSTSIRIEALSVASDRIADAPVLGYGVGAAGAAGRAFDVADNFETESYPLNLMIELGLLGLLALGYALLFVWRRLSPEGRLALAAVLIANVLAPTMINPSVGLAVVLLALLSTIKQGDG